MKFFSQIILVMLFAYLAQFVLPWWGVFPAAGLAGLLVPNKGAATFAAGLLGVALLWFGQVYLIDAANESILSSKVAGIFGLSSSLLLMLATSAIGGIAGGFAALTGKLFRDLFKKKQERYSVYS